MTNNVETRTPKNSESLVSELMLPHQVNSHGNIFGGVLLAMVDRAAAVAAMRHSGHPVVTVSIDRVDFKEPIFTGELLNCRARVNYVGRTSMEIGVRVEAENLLTRDKRHTNTCYLTFVAIDSNHRPVEVPPLIPETEIDEKRFREGQRRREVRIALAKEMGSD